MVVTYLLVSAQSLVILLLLWALVAGQPAAIPELRGQVQAQSTEVARYRATVIARPAPTAVPASR